MNTPTSKDFKIVFLGTPDFATHILRRIVEEGYNVVAAVTMPDKPAGRGHKLQPSSVKAYAIEQGIPVLQPERLKDETFLSVLKALEADLFIVVAFRMLPKEVWGMPPRGTFNLHASLLPKYRGAAPIQHAILNGEAVTGVTTFFLDEQIDTGQILLRKEVQLSPQETGGTLHDKLMRTGADLVVETIDLILNNDVVPSIPQLEIGEDQTSLPQAPKIFKEDRLLHFSTRTAIEIERRVRAMSPYPATITTWHMKDDTNIEVKVFEAELPEAEAILSPGQMNPTKEGLLVGTIQGTVLLKTIQMPSKRPMSAKDLANGFDLSSVVKVL